MGSPPQELEFHGPVGPGNSSNKNCPKGGIMHALYVTPAWAVLYVSGVQCLVSVMNFYWSEPWPRCTIYLKSILYNVDVIRGPESA